MNNSDRQKKKSPPLLLFVWMIIALTSCAERSDFAAGPWHLASKSVHWMRGPIKEKGDLQVLTYYPAGQSEVKRTENITVLIYSGERHSRGTIKMDPLNFDEDMKHATLVEHFNDGKDGTFEVTFADGRWAFIRGKIFDAGATNLIYTNKDSSLSADFRKAWEKTIIKAKFELPRATDNDGAAPHRV